MSRIGRSQPIQPIGWHGFVDSGVGAPGTGPPPVNVVPLYDQRQRLSVLPAIVLSGAFAPLSDVVRPPVNIDRDDQRLRRQPLDSVVISGALAGVTGPVATPPPVNVVPFNPTRQYLRPGEQPFIAAHGFVDSGVGAPGTTPPPAAFVPLRGDQRTRYLPLDSISISGALDSVTVAPTPAPPAPFVVPLDLRRRFLAALPPEFNVGFDDVKPVVPNVVEPDRPRRAPLDSFTASPAAAAAATPPSVTPPAPFVVPIDQRGRFLIVLPATGQHGFVGSGVGAPGTAPPPVVSIDRVDQRVLYQPLKPLILSGVLAPPPPAAVVQGFDDWAPLSVLY